MDLPKYTHYWLVVSNMFLFFHNIWDIWDNPSQLTFIFFRGIETTNQIISWVHEYTPNKNPHFFSCFLTLPTTWPRPVPLIFEVQTATLVMFIDMASALNGNIMEIYWGYRLTGWWFGTMEFYFVIYWEFHHPNWRTPSFFRGVAQPPTS